MSTQDEILKSFEKQFNMMRDQLLHGCYENAVTSANIFSKWLEVKVDELGKKESD
jgi:hypothetical protein